ncbi:hypothetical protein Glove_271g71 [Diversispora epigaea]|uniref:BTB domain-containing protein n=1 Tax=Diversispora epigaea TaxID=1348612 RepID=A0A397I899_9GLOM|nr:hypothetical protein Glove_271g71 [Diversispora epigaea]
MNFKFFDKLSQNFIEILDDKDDYNVIIIVKNGKSFKAHSSVLKRRAPYFHKELENIIPNENNIKTITKPNISDEIFGMIFKYIYGGIVNLENAEIRFIFDLMLAANEFELEELTEKLETFLIKTQCTWLKSHISLVYHSVNNRKNLKKFCNDVLAIFPSLIFDEEDFISIQESSLISLLERDDLRLEEIKIWEYTIKWGIAQNSTTLPVDLKEWTNENFKTLKNSLKKCLPLIRYFHISSSDVWVKVKPYKKILDKQLWEDLNQHFLAPNEPTKSTVLPKRATQKIPYHIKH